MATKIAKLAAGTKFLVSYDGAKTFVKIEGITAVGDIGEMSETQETTDLECTDRTYIAGLGTPADKAIVGNLLTDDTDQAKFIVAARNRGNVYIRIVLPTNPKMVSVNRVALLGFQVNAPAPDGTLQFTINGKGSGKTIWYNDNTIDITAIYATALTNYVAVGGTLKLSLTYVPEDATVAAGQITYESLNSEIATVKSDGTITGVKTGEFGIKIVDTYSEQETLFFGRVVAA